MTDSEESAEKGSSTGVIAGAAGAGGLLLYLMAPGICIALLGDVPNWMMPAFGPLVWLYDHCAPYEVFIDACNWR